MTERIPQSATIRVALKVFLSSDHISAATGKTVAVVISKNGGAFGNPSAGATNATEIANGWYYVDLSTTDTGTAGPLIVRGTSASCDDSEAAYNVVNANNAGLAALPNAAAESPGGLYTRGTGAGQINQPANGMIDANAVRMGNTVLTARDIGASVLLSAGTGTGQLDFTSGVVKANVTQFGGVAGTFSGGRPEVNTTHWAATSITTGVPLAPTVAGRTLDVTTTGGAGIDWGNVENQATVVNLSNTSVDTVDTVATIVNNVTASSVLGDVGGNVIGNVNGSIGSVATNGIAAASLATAACQKIAHVTLRRTMANVEAAADGDALDKSSLYGSIQQKQKSSAAGATLTIKKTDGTTLGTLTLTTDAAAVQIIGVS